MRELIRIAAAVVIASTACSTPEPALPSSAQPTTVHEFLTGPDGPPKLRDISTYKWPDDGAKPATYFEWIGPDASSTDPAAATRAGETAHALASFLGGNRSDLDAVSPKLVAAYGEALTPFQAAMVGDTDGVRGFGRLGSSGDYATARGVFAVIATNPEARTAFIDSAYARAQTMAADAARAGCVDRSLTGGTVPAAVRGAAALSGLAASVDPKGDERRQSIDEVTRAMAAACLTVTPQPPQGRITQFIENGALMSPDAASQRDPALEDYFQSQRDYLAVQGLDLSDFRDAYDEARG